MMQRKSCLRWKLSKINIKKTPNPQYRKDRKYSLLFCIRWRAIPLIWSCLATVPTTLNQRSIWGKETFSMHLAKHLQLWGTGRCAPKSLPVLQSQSLLLFPCTESEVAASALGYQPCSNDNFSGFCVLHWGHFRRSCQGKAGAQPLGVTHSELHLVTGCHAGIFIYTCS